LIVCKEQRIFTTSKFSSRGGAMLTGFEFVVLYGNLLDSPSEISEVVARRCKDFTKEFFVHLHTVAESYYDNPTEQDGENE
jgi:hypothetical protein